MRWKFDNYSCTVNLRSWEYALLLHELIRVPSGVRTEKELYSHGVKTQTLTLVRRDVHFRMFSSTNTSSDDFSVTRVYLEEEHRRVTMDLDFGRSLDRISKLPDSVLCHILSFLPTKYAVGTSILSTRWKYLWTSVATLDFNDSELFNKRHRTNGIGEAEVDLRFTNFVNTVLLLSDVSCLEKFNLKLESVCYFGIVKAWISTAIKRNVQKLELRYSAWHNFEGQIPIQLPHLLFICKTLVDLRLDGNISLKVPASVWLPSLKILEIKEVIYENGDSAHNLIHGCPALEDLHIYRLYFDKQKVLNISVPTLKRLVLNRQGDDAHLLFSDHDGESQHKLIVNTPKLEYLDIRDHDADEFSFENLSSLLDARINVGLCFSGPVSSSNLLKLLHGIGNVKFLRFSSTNYDDYVLPTMNPLHNLTYLGLQDASADGWNTDLLNVFLEYSPNLEVLVLEGDRIMRSYRLWSPPPQVPSCLLLNLKQIEYLNFGGEQHEFEVIEYLLKSAEVLKNMTISCQHLDSWRLLARFPRASKICELNLH